MPEDFAHMPDPTPTDDDRVVIYAGLAYSRLADGIVAALPHGRAEEIPPAAVPLPVRRALHVTD
jgi:hypothetical protein